VAFFLEELQYEHCFGRSNFNESLINTFEIIEEILNKIFNLPLPGWWSEMYYFK
jgi:hypothetical protein